MCKTIVKTQLEQYSLISTSDHSFEVFHSHSSCCYEQGTSDLAEVGLKLLPSLKTYTWCKQSQKKYPRSGGGWKKGSQIRLKACVVAYRHTRTELTKNRFHTFPLSSFIFIKYVKNIDLPTTHIVLLTEPTIAKCILDNFVVSIWHGKLAVV